MVKALVRSVLSLIAIIPLLAIVPVIPSSVLASPEEAASVAQRSPGDTGDEELTWFEWNDDVYALADDGQALWIGNAMGVLRWDKATGDVDRYTAIDGLPSTHVYAVAVDRAGNRWFGGNGGLSRLDAEGTWFHFTPENSGLAGVLVDDIAVGADGTLWVSHGLPDGPVSRLASNGTWTTYPDVTAAVVADYQAILATQNRNPLWLVSGDEVWMGFWVYDGASWRNRSPDAAGEKGSAGLPDASAPRPKAIDVDSSGAVWAMADYDEATHIIAWREGGWSDHTPPWCFSLAGLHDLAVAGDDTVWIGYSVVSGPPGPLTVYAAVTPLPTGSCTDLRNTYRQPPVQSSCCYGGGRVGRWAGLVAAAQRRYNRSGYTGLFRSLRCPGRR